MHLIRPAALRPLKRTRFARRFVTAFVALAVSAAGLGVASPAHAEGQIRIAEQFGIVYLLLNVARDVQ
jgi:NitT/TauT family transport system substrate-binding protein